MPSWSVSRSGPPVEVAEFVAKEIREGVNKASEDVDGWEGSNAVTVAHMVEGTIRSVGRNLQARFTGIEEGLYRERYIAAEVKARESGEQFEKPEPAPKAPNIMAVCGGSITHDGIKLHDLRVWLDNVG